MKKFARRAVALLLAALLVAALPLNVAATDAENVTIGGYDYYCSLNCQSTYATGTTETINNEVTVGVYVKLFVDDVRVADGGAYNQDNYAGVRVSYKTSVDYATAEHKCDNSTFYQTMDYAS